MFLVSGTMPYTNAFSANELPPGMAATTKWLNRAEAVLVGIGAGMSASAGLDYTDHEFFLSHYAPFAEQGYENIWSVIQDFWDINPANARAFWGFWAWHIHAVYYQPPGLTPYKQLAEILRDKNYFIISSNADGQLHKLGLDEQRLFLPQGEYGLMQCPLPCHEEVYSNKVWVDAIRKNMGPDLLAREEDLPRCPHCGRLMTPNLRKDDHFVDKLYQEGYPRYRAWLLANLGRPALLLELGVGFNTPGIIRYPFEQMLETHPSARLLRVNRDREEVPAHLGNHALGLNQDITVFLNALEQAQNEWDHI